MLDRCGVSRWPDLLLCGRPVHCGRSRRDGPGPPGLVAVGAPVRQRGAQRKARKAVGCMLLLVDIIVFVDHGAGMFLVVFPLTR
jgi:hypothetical protein